MKIIITGATGMVGEGTLHESVLSPEVEKILVIGRRPCGIIHAKMEELILADFVNPGHALDDVKGYDACFFCLGISSVGLDKPTYETMTHTLTLNFAKAIMPNNPGMSFLYISGAGTDSSEKGRIHWARVKGKTENDLLKLGFKSAYALRPGYMHPTPGLKNTNKWAKYVTWMYPIAKIIAPRHIMTLGEVGRAMIELARVGYSKKVLEAPDILTLAEQSSRFTETTADFEP
jgi:uncharacterized protein YbjT (DUF2867 family)